jgi:hypothetical protein
MAAASALAALHAAGNDAARGVASAEHGRIAWGSPDDDPDVLGDAFFDGDLAWHTFLRYSQRQVTASPPNSPSPKARDS